MFPPPDLGSREQKMKQIKNWAGSETDKSSAEYHPPKKIKFPLGVALIAACYANDEEEFKRLLSLGIDINTRNPDGMTCVHQCCINGDYEFLEFLIKEGADINVQDNEGWTPLHAAASVGCEEMVRLLLDNGADLSLLSCEMELPVDVSQNDAVTELLNEAMQARGIDPTAARQTEEQLLLRDVKHMLELGKYEPVIDPRSGATPLHVAACKDYLTVLEMLLKIPGIDLNSQDNDGWTALHAAAHWNREASVRLLAEAGASFDLYTFANQSVFDVADRQITLLLRQLRERQRVEMKSVGPSPVPVVAEPPPKPTEAVKRGHPSDSESSEEHSDDDSEQSESTSDSEESSISANKKPALDGKINAVTAVSAAAGDQSSSALLVEPNQASLKSLPAEPSKPLMRDASPNFKSDRQFQEPAEPMATDERFAMPAQQLSQSPVSPPASPNALVNSASASDSTTEGSSTFGSTDTDSGQTPFALDPMDIASKQTVPSSVSPTVTDITQKHISENKELVPDPTFATNVPSNLVAEAPVTPSINGNKEPYSAPSMSNSVPTDAKESKAAIITATDTTSQSDRSEPRRTNDRMHESHARLRSPPARPIQAPARSPSPTTERPASSVTTRDEIKPQPSRSARIVTIRKRIPMDSTTEQAVSETSTASGSLPAVTVSATPVSPTTPTAVRSPGISMKPEVTRSPSPVSGDEYQGNRRVSVVMAPTKSGETETQRSVKARYVRSTRRSTQGVSAEELEKAKRLIDKNNSAAVPSPTASSGAPVADVPPQEKPQSEASKTDEGPGESLRPRLDRPTVRITRAMAARTTSVSSSPTTDSVESDGASHARRRLPQPDRADSESSADAGADDKSRSHRGYRTASEADDRVKPSDTRDNVSSSATYFPYRGISARVPTAEEANDRSSLRNQSSTEVQNIQPRGSRERAMRDQLLEASENLERRIPLSQRRAMRQSAPSPTSPPPGHSSTANASSNDSAVKPVIPRPSSRFLHSNDSSVSSAPNVSTNSGTSGVMSNASTTSTNAWNPSHVTGRSGVGATHQQQANASWAAPSRHVSDSRTALRDRLNQYQGTVDYRRLYEQERAEKERLKRELEETMRNVARLRIELASLTRTESNHPTTTGVGNSAVHSADETPTQYPRLLKVRRFRINGDTLKRVEPVARGKHEDEGRERCTDSRDQ